MDLIFSSPQLQSTHTSWTNQCFSNVLRICQLNTDRHGPQYSFVFFRMIHLLDTFLNKCCLLTKIVSQNVFSVILNVWAKKPNICLILACCVTKTSLYRKVIRTCYGSVVVYQFVCTPWIEKLFFWSVHCE